MDPKEQMVLQGTMVGTEAYILTQAFVRTLHGQCCWVCSAEEICDLTQPPQNLLINVLPLLSSVHLMDNALSIFNSGTSCL